MKTFSAQGVCLNYQGGARAIRQFELDFEVKILVVYGGECSGKTSLIKSVAGLEDYDGEFFLNGNLLKRAPKEQDIFALFEDYCLMPKKTVYENLAYPLRLRGLNKQETENRVNKAIAEFKLEDYTKIRVRNLNDRLKAYVGMSKIQLRSAELYLFDDILRVFKNEEWKICINKLKHIFNELDGMIIYATSNYEEALIFADKIAIIKAGIIEQYGTAEEIAKNPCSVYVAEVVSSGQTVFEYSMLNATDTILSVNYNNQNIVLDNSYRKRLINDIYIGKEVLVGEYLYKNKKQYLIMDTETEKSILK